MPGKHNTLTHAGHVVVGKHPDIGRLADFSSEGIVFCREPLIRLIRGQRPHYMLLHYSLDTKIKRSIDMDACWRLVDLWSAYVLQHGESMREGCLEVHHNYGNINLVTTDCVEFSIETISLLTVPANQEDSDTRKNRTKTLLVNFQGQDVLDCTGEETPFGHYLKRIKDTQWNAENVSSKEKGG